MKFVVLVFRSSRVHVWSCAILMRSDVIANQLVSQGVKAVFQIVFGFKLLVLSCRCLLASCRPVIWSLLVRTFGVCLLFWWCFRLLQLCTVLKVIDFNRCAAVILSGGRRGFSNSNLFGLCIRVHFPVVRRSQKLPWADSILPFFMLPLVCLSSKIWRYSEALRCLCVQYLAEHPVYPLNRQTRFCLYGCLSLVLCCRFRVFKVSFFCVSGSLPAFRLSMVSHGKIFSLETSCESG